MKSAGVLLVLPVCAVLAWGQTDPPPTVLTSARQLVGSRQPDQAISLLDKHLAEHPNDVDALLLRGLICSWESRWEEGRRNLRTVLESAPGYKDARLGLINLELWSSNPDRAAAAAAEALQQAPGDKEYTAALRKAILQSQEAKRQQSPPAATAAGERADVKAGWEVGVERSQIWFSDQRPSWREQAYTIARNTPWGYITGNYHRASQGSVSDGLVELEMYPRIAKGTYGFVNFGVSQSSELFAKRRFGAELFKSLPRGFETSAGFRHFQFHDAVNMATGSLAKYFGNWWINSRVFLTPGTDGVSRSIQFSARRYFGDAEHFIGFRGGIGASPFEVRSINETGFLQSETYGFEALWKFPNRLRLRGNAGMSRQERLFTRERIKFYSAGITLYYGL
jgi:YaiO family outer membrane protein